jgi:hypothetical protein
VTSYRIQPAICITTSRAALRAVHSHDHLTHYASMPRRRHADEVPRTRRGHAGAQDRHPMSLNRRRPSQASGMNDSQPPVPRFRDNDLLRAIQLSPGPWLGQLLARRLGLEPATLQAAALEGLSSCSRCNYYCDRRTSSQDRGLPWQGSALALRGQRQTAVRIIAG